MNSIKTISLFLLLSTASSMFSMENTTVVLTNNPPPDINVVRGKKLIEDINAVEKSETPDEAARLIMAATYITGWKAPYLQVATETGCKKAFSAFLKTDAPCVSDVNKEYPMDVVLRKGDKDALDELLAKKGYSKCSQSTVDTLLENNPEILKICIAKMNAVKAQNPKPLLRFQHKIMSSKSGHHTLEYAKQGLIYVPSNKEFTEYYDTSSKALFIGGIVSLYQEPYRSYPEKLSPKLLLETAYLLVTHKVASTKKISETDYTAHVALDKGASDLIYKYATENATQCPTSSEHTTPEAAAAFIRKKIAPFTKHPEKKPESQSKFYKMRHPFQKTVTPILDQPNNTALATAE